MKPPKPSYEVVEVENGAWAVERVQLSPRGVTVRTSLVCVGDQQEAERTRDALQERAERL